MRGRKTHVFHRPYPKGEHTSAQIPDHDAVLDTIESDPKKYGIRDYLSYEREARIIHEKPTLTPDFIFHHSDGSVTVIEAGSSPYATAVGNDISKLERARGHFRDKGIACTCLVAYLSNGRLKVETPVQIALMDIADERLKKSGKP